MHTNRKLNNKSIALNCPKSPLTSDITELEID